MIVDLGYAGRSTYDDWNRVFKTRLLSLYGYATELEGYRWVKRVLEHGRGKLLDRTGIDWWDTLSAGTYQDIHLLYLFQRLQSEIGNAPVELWATGSHRSVSIAEKLFGRCRGYQTRPETLVGRVRRAARAARRLRPSQIAEIAFDKWDPDYRFRRRWARGSRARLSTPAILLPSAYSNVTHSELAYARLLPGRRFLLATTRRNAVPDVLPKNVQMAPLAAYALSPEATEEEAASMKGDWPGFVQKTTCDSHEFAICSQAGVWDDFPSHIEHGLRLREAWNHILRSEPIAGVLCGDDLNYHTRLPLLLARRAGIRSIYCSHGALDGGFLFKTAIADSYLVKGEMERDYIQRVCDLPSEKISVGAPDTSMQTHNSPQSGEAIVFFSQPYEVLGGRAGAMYREILPQLWAVAHRSQRKLIVKLHPFESKKARRELVDSILREHPKPQVEIVGGGSPEHVMAQAWCGVTVDSSVAVECAVRNIPVFLCSWLAFTGIGYVQQFARFHVAHVVDSPEGLEQIPEKIAEYRSDQASRHRFWQAADPSQLDEIMFGTRQGRLDSCVC